MITRNGISLWAQPDEQAQAGRRHLRGADQEGELAVAAKYLYKPSAISSALYWDMMPQLLLA